MKRVSIIVLLCILSQFGYAYQQIYRHTLQVGQTIEAEVGNVDCLNPHCAYLYLRTNYVTVHALSRGTAFSIDRSTNLHIYKVVDVVSIEIPQNVNLSLGEEFTYKPIVTDSEANTTLTWKSSNTSVATINSSGKVTPVGIGKTVITCTATNGIATQSLITVTPVLAQEVTLNEQGTKEMTINSNIDLTATILPENATSKGIRWLSGNDNIAQVDDEGNVTAISPGYCNIYAIAADGSGMYDRCLIHVQGATNSRGDVNGDGGITAQDASLILQYVAKKISW